MLLGQTFSRNNFQVLQSTAHFELRQSNMITAPLPPSLAQKRHDLRFGRVNIA